MNFRHVHRMPLSELQVLCGQIDVNKLFYMSIKRCVILIMLTGVRHILNIQNSFNFLGEGKLEFEWDFKRFKEGTTERKLFLEVVHHQTVDPHARAPQVVRGLFLCPSTNF